MVKVLLIPSRWVGVSDERVCVCVGGTGASAAGGVEASRPDNSDVVVHSSAPPALAQNFSYMLIWG